MAIKHTKSYNFFFVGVRLAPFFLYDNKDGVITLCAFTHIEM